MPPEGMLSKLCSTNLSLEIQTKGVCVCAWRIKRNFLPDLVSNSSKARDAERAK